MSKGKNTDNPMDKVRTPSFNQERLETIKKISYEKTYS